MAEGCFDIMKTADPSPIVIPWRLALKGLHNDSDVNSSASNPFNVTPHNESTPPTRTASQIPALINRAAEQKASGSIRVDVDGVSIDLPAEAVEIEMETLSAGLAVDVLRLEGASVLVRR